jgi:hypothetical protein
MIDRMQARERERQSQHDHEGGDPGATDPKSPIHDDMMVSEGEVVDCLKKFLAYRSNVLADGAEAASPDAAIVPSPPSMGVTLQADTKAGAASPPSALALTGAASPSSKTRSQTTPLVDPLTGKKDALSGKASTSVWKICANAVPMATIAVWKEVYKFLSKYNLILQERRQLIEDVERLRAQNRELKMLLNQYLTSKVNGQLYVPPTATITRNHE